jgi:ParB family transcriptional regulator, chromosome partitioning protein
MAPKVPGLGTAFSAQAQISQVEQELQHAQDRIEELESMLDDSKTQSSYTSLRLEQIVQDFTQVRKYFNSDMISALADSIKTHGVLEPLIVRPLASGVYKLVAGERRFRASQIAGLQEVPVTIRQMDDVEALELSLVENLQREDLNPVEQTEGVLQLLSSLLNQPQVEVVALLYRMSNEHKGKVTHNVMGNSETKIVQDIFRRITSMEWQSFVANRLPLLNLPKDILEALHQGSIEYTKARAVAQIKDEDGRRILLNETIQHGLSLTEIRQQLKEFKPVPEDTLKNRFKNVTTQVLKLPTKNWQDPKKAQKIAKLLEQLETLLDA